MLTMFEETDYIFTSPDFFCGQKTCDKSLGPLVDRQKSTVISNKSKQNLKINSPVDTVDTWMGP